MSKRRFTPEEKMNIVLESLRGDIKKAEICRQYNIYPSDLQRWTDQFMSSGLEGLKANGSKSKEDPRIKELEAQVKKLEKTIVDLSIENQILKKKVD